MTANLTAWNEVGCDLGKERNPEEAGTRQGENVETAAAWVEEQRLEGKEGK